MNRRQAEFERRRAEREEQISRMIQARKLEREAMRKKIFFVKSEEERLKKLHEEEEARKREGNVKYVRITNSILYNNVNLIEGKLSFLY